MDKMLSDSLVATEWNIPMITSIHGYSELITLMMRTLVEVPVHGIRSFGSAAISLARVAEGSIDLYYEIGIHSWDIAAGILLVLESGGSVENLYGLKNASSFDMNGRNVIAAKNSHLMYQYKKRIETLSAIPLLAQVMDGIRPDCFKN